MKRYEKMSQEEIVKLIEAVGELDCNTCPLKERCIKTDRSCSARTARYLQEEVITKPRFMAFKSAEELNMAINEYNQECADKKCSECEKANYENTYANCIAKWLCEEIEVAE